MSASTGRGMKSMISLGVWRNGSASDSRSEGWEFESLCPHFLVGGFERVSKCVLAWPLRRKFDGQFSTRWRKRAHPDLNQGPADLQSAALTTELCTHMTGHDSIAVFPHLRELVQMPVRLDGVQAGCVQAGWKSAPTTATPNERVYENVHTRSRTWIVAATTRRPNH